MYKTCELDPQQKKLWEQTRAALMWACPAFTHIFYTLLNNSKSEYIAVFTEDVPIAATDGINLILNPNTFFKYNLHERVFACAHEILHGVLDHMGMLHQVKRTGKIGYPDGTSLPFSMELMNVALDLVINDTLIESKIGMFNKDWLHNKRIGTHMDSGLDVYKKLFKATNGGAGNGGIGVEQVTGGGKGFDEHLPPGKSQGKDPQAAVNDRNENKWKTEIAAAVASAKAQGKLPGALERLLNEVLEPQVDWRDKIQALFARKVGTGSYNFRQPDRRLICRDIIAPGRSGFGANIVAVGADTSGSIGAKELDMFFAEIAGILEDVKPKEIILIWCDAAVNRVDEVYEPSDLNTIRHKGAPGGGGTSFIPVFQYLAEHGIEPDALVYLTDGMGSFPSKAPSYPVIWGSIYEGSTYPFGDVVPIPKQA